MKKQKEACMGAKKIKGSILAYSLIILAMMFAIVTSMSVVGILENKSSGSSQSSAQAYQVADSGAQITIKRINSVISSSNNKIEDAFGGNCSGGVFNGSGNTELGGDMMYDLVLFDNSTVPAAITDCSKPVSDIASIKVTGNFKNTVRAVNVAMEAN